MTRPTPHGKNRQKRSAGCKTTSGAVAQEPASSMQKVCVGADKSGTGKRCASLKMRTRRTPRAQNRAAKRHLHRKARSPSDCCAHHESRCGHGSRRLRSAGLQRRARPGPWCGGGLGSSACRWHEQHRYQHPHGLTRMTSPHPPPIWRTNHSRRRLLGVVGDRRHRFR